MVLVNQGTYMLREVYSFVLLFPIRTGWKSGWNLVAVISVFSWLASFLNGSD